MVDKFSCSGPVGCRVARRTATVAACTVWLCTGVPAERSWAGALLPERGGSPNADRIASLYAVVLVLAALVFLGVVVALAYALRRYGEKRSPVAAQIRGNNRLEIGWTVAASGLIVVLAVFSLTKLHAIDHPDPAAASSAAIHAGVVPAGAGQPLHIDVVGQQYIWKYRYPGGAYSYGEMVAPVGVTVELAITSRDVAHSWWIPKLGGKFDAIPGYVNHTWFRLQRPAVYRGQCAELCGRNHADMLAQVRGVSPAEYVAWLAEQKQSIQAAAAEARTPPMSSEGG
jgi:cytochrome c oxidase subunit II